MLHRDSTIPDRRALDSELIEALLQGDNSAFFQVVNRYNRAMVRLAMAYVPSRALAEEVVQEAWMAMVQGLSGFKGQSSLRTWLFGILLNRAKTCGTKERRSVSFSSMAVRSTGEEVDDWLAIRDRVSDRLTPVWSRSALGISPEDCALTTELRLTLEDSIRNLPPAQRAVIILRDVEGWSSGEVCELLGISPENQRVRLHRARLAVRAAVERYLLRR